MDEGKVACPCFFDFLFLFGYFYLPSESMSNLYHRIPAQVRENSQLVAAYYYSQTGFDGFREYQFALYDPENKTISIYTFKTYKFLKIWPRMKKSKITCKTPFNYSTLSTNPEKLKDFKNCNNCRQLLYRDRVYRNGEIESIYPSMQDIVNNQEKNNSKYIELAVIKSSELSIGSLELSSGDTIRYSDPFEYADLLYLPGMMEDPMKGIILEILPIDNQSARRKVIYPGGVIFTDNIKFKVLTNETWTLREVPWEQVFEKIEPERFKQTIKGSLRFTISIFKYDGKLEVFSDWINTENNFHAYWRIYPSNSIQKIYFDRILGYHCG